MVRVRRGMERGHFDHGWLNTYHTFSFAGYQDRAQMGFRSLRVMNEDWIAPGRGFGAHPHENVEIVTYVLSGELVHKDSLGTGSTIRPGELQRMTAGTGIVHSEFNPSATEPVHLYQIWMYPERAGLEPSYEQKAFSEEERRGRLRLVASPDGRDGSLSIRQDARLYLALMEGGEEISHELGPGRHAWVQVLRGEVALGELAISAGDGAAITEERSLAIRAGGQAEVLVFDLP